MAQRGGAIRLLYVFTVKNVGDRPLAAIRFTHASWGDPPRDVVIQDIHLALEPGEMKSDSYLGPAFSPGIYNKGTGPRHAVHVASQSELGCRIFAVLNRDGTTWRAEPSNVPPTASTPFY